jgi:hypothetical protein
LQRTATLKITKEYNTVRATCVYCIQDMREHTVAITSEPDFGAPELAAPKLLSELAHDSLFIATSIVQFPHLRCCRLCLQHQSRINQFAAVVNFQDLDTVAPLTIPENETV